MRSTPIGASARRKAAALRRNARGASTNVGAGGGGGAVDSEGGCGSDNFDGNDPRRRLSMTSENAGVVYDSPIPWKTAKPKPPSHFSSYLRFDRIALSCLAGFFCCYILVLLCFLPMITFVPPDGTSPDHPADAGVRLRRGASFDRVHGRDAVVHAVGAVRQRAGSIEERARQVKERAMAKAKAKISAAGIGRRDGADAARASALLENAVAEFEKEVEEKELERGADIKRAGDLHEGGAAAALKRAGVPAVGAENTDGEESGDEERRVGGAGKRERRGFVILGMHRSGTSMLSGLLVKGFGYHTGGPLIMPSFDNEKGFYERIDVVLQNDEFFRTQHMGWNYDVIRYDSDKALEDRTIGTVEFKEGRKALVFLNDPNSAPWLQKDPRMCIVLPTWLKLLDDEPAVVFTYRHPLEVAMSLKKREDSFTLEHGLRLWIVYNMRAIQNSAGLCRVLSSNEAILSDPMREVQRISDDLRKKCRMTAPPTEKLSKQIVEEFVDPSLQHNKKQNEAEDAKREVLADFGDGCLARDFKSDYPKGSSNHKSDVDMYLMAMFVYCDLKSGKAYADDYEWPDLVNMKRPARIG